MNLSQPTTPHTHASTLHTPSLTLSRIPVTHPAFHHIRNWDAMDTVHKAVMSLFPDNLPGPTNERRSQSHILYRIDTNPSPHILLQTTYPLTDPLIDTLTMTPILSAIHNNGSVNFRIRANTAVRIKGSPKRTAITNDQLPRKISTLLGDALHDINVIDIRHSVLRGKSKTPLNTHLITGVATVTDTDTLIHKIVNGAGAARAYGCGLLSVAPVS
jgi:CRISPR system Cascade subunit CasE